jgi:Glycosyltransferase family 87
VWCEPVWTTLRYGQINLAVAVLVLWDLTRREGHRWAGFGTGVAAGIKLTPGLFVVFLAAAGLIDAIRRQRAGQGLRSDHLRRAGVATGAFVWTVVLSVVALPYDAHRFWTQVLFATDRPGDVEGAGNQNLRGALARVLHTPDPGLWWLAAATLIGCVGLATAVAAQLADDRTLPHARAWAAVTCAVTALMVSPISWSHHWVWAVPMVLLLAVETVRRASRAWAGCTALTGLLFCSFMIWYAPHSMKQRVELHQTPPQMLMTAAYPIIATAFLATAAWVTYRALRGPGAQPAPRPTASAGMGAGAGASRESRVLTRAGSG